MFEAKERKFYVEEETPTAFFVNWVQDGRWNTKKFIAVKDLKAEVAAEFGINADEYEFLTDFDYPPEYYIK